MLARACVTALALFFCPGKARAANFNDILPGAKAMGMGQAFSAIADGPFAMFWNPAGTANTPYSELGTSLGRQFSDRGALAIGSLAYIRPYEPIKTATIGTAYFAERQLNSGDKDVFLFHYSQEFNVPQLSLSKPLKVGGNFKILNAEQGGGSGFGFGFDGGILARTNMGLSGAFTILDLTTNVGLPHPTIGMGLSYLWKRWLILAMDMRVRSNLTEFYPGVEVAFYEGLLKGRVGRGFQLDGAGNLALGIGINFSPVIIDVGMGVPWDGANRQSGGYHATVTYRFGAPPFAGNFVGAAASEAETLKEDILRLEERKSALQSEAAAAENNRETARGELTAADARIRVAQKQYDQLLKKKEEAAYQLSNYELSLRNLKPPPPKPAPKPLPRPIPWPRRHTVAAGDTLRTIAHSYYGDPNLWERIYDANRDKIERGLPREGAVLVVPEPKR